MYNNAKTFSKDEVIGSFFCGQRTKGKIKVYRNIQEENNMNNLDTYFTETNIKTLVVIPLYYEDELIGFVDLSSQEENAVNYLDLWKFEELVAPFTLAVKSLMDAFYAHLDGVIRKNCTVIHKSVEWRFQQAAKKGFLEGDKQSMVMDDIIFNDVYPLFGVSDIRGSSDKRNKSIQKDIVFQLENIKQILNVAKEVITFPYLEEVEFRLEKYKNSIEKNMNAGDEVDIFNFISNEINPLIQTLRTRHLLINREVFRYEKILDPDLNMVYRKRKIFNESIKELNYYLAKYLDQEQKKAQKIFPHYFEKQLTDGVDHNIYIGSSLVHNLEFHQIYLKNIRLWQISTMCGLAGVGDFLYDKIPQKLELAHLVIMQNNPISICFDYDEKKFGPQGAYNIRYEIVKKRIDKAKIKGTNERLTLPEHLSIVFSQDAEKLELKKYLEYLRFKKWVDKEIEFVVLEDLQGVSGLKAVRVKVNCKHIRNELSLDYKLAV